MKRAATKRDHFLPWWVGDYLADTRHLTTEQHGAYLLLLAHQWRTGPLPDDAVQLATIVNMTTPAWRRRCEAVVMRFFVQTLDGWVQMRLEAERVRVAGTSEKRAENGRRGAVVLHRKGRTQSAEKTAKTASRDMAGPQAGLQQNGGIPEPDSNSSLRSESESPQRPLPLLRVVGEAGESKPPPGKGRRGRHAYSVDFEAWWTRYPNKTAKDAAWASYQRAIQAGASPTDLASGLARYTFNPDPQYHPHATTWLNQGRWKDPARPAPINGGQNGPASPQRARAGAGDDPTTFSAVMRAFADVAGGVDPG